MAFKSVFNLFGNNTEFPSDYINYYNQGLKFSKSEKYRNALKYYESAIELNPYVPEVYVEKGIALFNLSSFNESLESFERALKLKADIKEASLYKGRILIKRENYKEALLSINNYLKLDSTNSNAFLYKSIALMGLGQNDEAFSCIEEALKLDPANKEANMKKASILVAKGCFSEAISYIDKIMDSEKNNSELYCEKAICLYKMKRFDDSLNYLDMTLRINNNCAEALYYKGVMYVNELFKYEEAITYLDKYSSLRPDDYKGYLQKTIALVELRKYHEALIEAKEAAKVNDKVPEVFFEEGLIYLLLSKWDEALYSLNKALELKPDYKEALEKKDYVQKMQSRINNVRDASYTNNIYERPVKSIKKEAVEEKIDAKLKKDSVTAAKKEEESKSVNNNTPVKEAASENTTSIIKENVVEEKPSDIEASITPKKENKNDKVTKPAEPVKKSIKEPDNEPLIKPAKKIEKEPIINSKPKIAKAPEENKITKQKPATDNNLDEDLKLFKYILEKDSIPINKIDIKDLLDGQDIIYSIEENSNEPEDMDVNKEMESNIETYNFEELGSFGLTEENKDFTKKPDIPNKAAAKKIEEDTDSSFDLDSFIISKANFISDAPEEVKKEDFNNTNNASRSISYDDEDLSSFIIESKPTLSEDQLKESTDENKDFIFEETPEEKSIKAHEEKSQEKPQEKVIFTKYPDFNADFKAEDLQKYDKLIDEVHFMPFEEGQNKLWKDVLGLDSWFVFENVYKFNGPYYENINGKLWLLTFTDTAHLSKCFKESYLNPDIINVYSINKLDDELINQLDNIGIYGLWFNKGQHCWFITLEDLRKLKVKRP